jgi:hypothetical protein
VRSADLFSSLLVNIGAVGLLGWIGLYFMPFVRSTGQPLPEQRFSYPIVILMILMMLAVPEFSYPTPWAFLGLSLMLSRSAPGGQQQGEAGMGFGESAA